MEEQQRQGTTRSCMPPATPSELFALLPHAKPFRFVDDILEIDDTHVATSYRLREDEFFYLGHFPDRPVTPGVILLEAMAQCGLVVHSLYLLLREIGAHEAARYRTLFTGAEAEWLEPTFPGSLVVVRSELVAWRSRRIRARVKMYDSRNTLVAQSTLSGVNVLWDQERFHRPERADPAAASQAEIGGAYVSNERAGK
jgi:3-hydroxyacyl-[acyl-carrier-protein] dehydratase